MEHTIPSFQDLLSVKVEDETFLKLEPKQKREKVFESLRDLMITVSHAKPLVMVVEDLHWIDDTSEDFLDYFIEWIANTPILLILLYRTEYQQKWSRKTYFHRIGLDHLRRDSSIELVKAMLEGGDVAPELRDLILERAAGNPLFMEEFTRALIENGTIKKQDSQYILSQKISDLHVPETVQGIIAARMDRLEENLKRTMQVASVIGRDFAFRILQTITGMKEELKSYLLNLQGLEFIYEKRLFPELEYIFKHALTQEVAYNSLLLKRRRQIHENIGRAIEEIYTERLEEFYEMLAYHYSKGDNLGKAFLYLKLSGEKAWRNYANYEAYNLYKEAFKILNYLPDNDERKKEKIEILKQMYGPIRLLGFPEGSLEIFETGETLSKEIGDKDSRASFYGYLGMYYTFKGKPLEGIRYVESRFYEANKEKDINLIVPLSLSLDLCYDLYGYQYKRIDFLPDVIALLESANKQHEYFNMPFNVYTYLHFRYVHNSIRLGNFEKLESILDKALKLAIKNNDKFSIAYYDYYYADFCGNKGNGRKAIEFAQNSIKSMEQLNYPFIVALSWLISGWGYYFMGDMETALKHVERGYEIQKNISVKYYISSYPQLIAFIYIDLGDLESAQKYAEEFLELAVNGNCRGAEGAAKTLLGRVLGRKKLTKNNEAEKYIFEGIKILEELKLKTELSQHGYFPLGEFYANCDENDKAFDWLNKAESEFKNMGLDYNLSFCKSLIGKTISKINASKFNEAEQIIPEAIQIAKNIESKPAEAFGYLCLGEIYADSGQKSKALDNLKKAEAMYQQMKMRLWLENAIKIMDRL